VGGLGGRKKRPRLGLERKVNLEKGQGSEEKKNSEGFAQIFVKLSEKTNQEDLEGGEKNRSQ